MLVERKTRLEQTVDALEREQTKLSLILEQNTLSQQQIRDIYSFAKAVRKGLEKADHDFQQRRRIVELFDVQAELSKEGDDQVVQVYCRLLSQEARVSLTSTTITGALS
jgi:hypothetical protein